MAPTKSLFALGLTLTGACASPSSDLTDEAAQEINGPSSGVSQFQLQLAVKIPGCTATRITAQFAIAAAHCVSGKGQTVKFYSSGPGFDNTLVANVEEVILRPGVNPVNCRDNIECTDSSGLFGDVELLRLSTDVVGTVDALGGPQATLAWSYPGANIAGQQVGAGGHGGAPNPTGILRQVTDTTDDSSDADGNFITTNDFVDPGDSGGPFYVGSRVVGTTTAQGWDPINGNYTLYTSVPRHLDWILTKIGYSWIGQPPQTSMVFQGTNTENFVGTERMCQYACEKTQSCEAYNYSAAGQSCGLYTSITGWHAQSGWRGALHYGSSTGKSNEVVGYVRSDGWNSVVHKSTAGDIHEVYRNGNQWYVGGIAPMSGQPIAGKLTGYRRADGINAILYRSTNSRIIEIALDPVQGWQAADLTSFGGNTAAGDPVAYVRADGASAVVFRSANNHINELRLGTKTWIPTDLTAATSSTSLPAAGDPTPFIRADGISSVVYRSGGAIIELFKTANQPWAVGGPSSLVVNGTAPAAAGRPYGSTKHSGIESIVYRSATNRLIELRLEATGWKFEDITSTGQTIAGDPVAHVRTDAIDAVVYRSTANQVNEITRPPLQGWNLSAQYSVFPLTTDPAVYTRNDSTTSIVYGLASNRMGELSYSPGIGWGSTNLSFSAGESP